MTEQKKKAEVGNIAFLNRKCAVCGKELKIELKEGAGTNIDGHFFGRIPLSMKNDPYHFRWLHTKEEKEQHKWYLPKKWNIFWNNYFYWVDEPGDDHYSIRSCSIWEVPWRILISYIKEKIDPTPYAEYWECDSCYKKAGKEEDT